MTAEIQAESSTIQNTREFRSVALRSVEYLIGMGIGILINYTIGKSSYKMDAPVLMAMGMFASIPINRFLERIALKSSFYALLHPHQIRVFTGGFMGGAGAMVWRNIL